VDTVALLHIYNHMPEVNAVIHTHQPYATAIGLVMDELPAFCTTLVNATLGAVTVAPYSSAASLSMGEKTVENIGDKRAVILRNHGSSLSGPRSRKLHAGVPRDAAATYRAPARWGSPASSPSRRSPTRWRLRLRPGEEMSGSTRAAAGAEQTHEARMASPQVPSTRRRS
jgi:hypothetical protein